MSLVLPLRILGATGLVLFFAAAFTPLPHTLSRALTVSRSLEPAGAIVVRNLCVKLCFDSLHVLRPFDVALAPLGG